MKAKTFQKKKCLLFKTNHISYHPMMMDIDNNDLLSHSLYSNINSDVSMYQVTWEKDIDDNMNLDLNIRDNCLYTFCIPAKKLSNALKKCDFQSSM
jgi:hypothetical protein